MSRRRPTQHDEIKTLATTIRCPDCHADRYFTEDAPGIYRLTLAHDETCPTYQRISSRKNTT